MVDSAYGNDDPEGIEFVREEDGSITARDLETGLARGGDTRAEALAQLAEVLELHEGGGEPISPCELAGILSDQEGETFRTVIAESYQNTKNE